MFSLIITGHMHSEELRIPHGTGHHVSEDKCCDEKKPPLKMDHDSVCIDEHGHEDEHCAKEKNLLDCCLEFCGSVDRLVGIFSPLTSILFSFDEESKVKPDDFIAAVDSIAGRDDLKGVVSDESIAAIQELREVVSSGEICADKLSIAIEAWKQSHTGSSAMEVGKELQEGNTCHSLSPEKRKLAAEGIIALGKALKEVQEHPEEGRDKEALIRRIVGLIDPTIQEVEKIHEKEKAGEKVALTEIKKFDRAIESMNEGTQELVEDARKNPSIGKFFSEETLQCMERFNKRYAEVMNIINTKSEYEIEEEQQIKATKAEFSDRRSAARAKFKAFAPELHAARAKQDQLVADLTRLTAHLLALGRSADSFEARDLRSKVSSQSALVNQLNSRASFLLSEQNVSAPLMLRVATLMKLSTINLNFDCHC